MMTTKLGRIVTYFEGLVLIKYMTLSSRVLTRSRDKLKSLYLHHGGAYGHQTWQYGDLP